MVIRFQPGADDGMQAVERPGRTLSNHPRSDPSQLFDADQLAQFRDALHEQRRFRLEQLVQLTAMPTSDQLGEVTDVLRTAASTALAEIDAALSRLRNGSYGRCTRCRRAILAERLEILPAAAFCMTCQHAAEASRH